jgi:transposase
MAYSLDFKKLVLKYRRSGHTVREACEFSGIVYSTFYEWEKEEKKGFPVTEKRSYEKKIRKEELRKAVEKKPDSYLRELAIPFGCTPQAIQKALCAMKITLKKRPSPIQKNPKKNGQNF